MTEDKSDANTVRAAIALVTAIAVGVGAFIIGPDLFPRHGHEVSFFGAMLTIFAFAGLILAICWPRRPPLPAERISKGN